MQLVTYILIGIIWIVRLYFFFKYEESERHEKEKAATLRNLALSYTGHLTWYLTPIHISFMVYMVRTYYCCNIL
jgi:heme/copper-type cytochrome/quinol oxidase subunit 2